ncbi:YdeI/OmpD-associated family protein [Dactylosporangium aurantiacum]|uniref:YdeI/OmpD-associated family protein n=1 Tax=Dactylosporangium aurantiacum TaxID=35754 RepID=A0A9Q9INJ7_9ACTN|nr:YdeI/OmpD-associated family protein [Dactylosporangium aurantiacum]MDG6109720.1 YdeI/OmpD-associated family protein [Dactylosporangium aurantiacum]UWZ56340.1 YdeI/OmpD-associated family protein [Dactylosporangium aurantiacum]
MAPVLFADAAAFEAWLGEHHATAAEVWIRVGRKGSGVASLSVGEALDVALCFGWIDGQRKGLDERHFLQRYVPRRPRSSWSQVNVAKVEALTAAGRMRPAGLAEVAKAQTDGRWAAAYPSQRTATVPPDLAAALAADHRARAAFEALPGTERYLIILRLLKLRTEAGRAARVRAVVERLGG